MLEKERIKEVPSEQRMEREETLQREHVEEHRAALRRAVSLDVPDARSPSTYGTFDESSVRGDGESASPCSPRESRQRMTWDELIDRVFEKDESGQMVLRQSIPPRGS